MADAATAAPPATDTMDPGALLASMREDRSRAQGEADTALARARAAEQKMLEAAPAVQPTPPEQQWGSMAMAVAALGGLLTHTPVTTAANAMAGVLNAYKANDVAKAQQSYEQWKAAHDAALKMADLEVKAYDDAIKEKASDPRGYQATMLALTSSFKNEGAARAAEAGNWTLMEQIVGGLKSRVDRMSSAGDKFGDLHEALAAWDADHPGANPIERRAAHAEIVKGKDPDAIGGGTSGALASNAELIANDEIAQREAGGTKLSDADKAGIRNAAIQKALRDRTAFSQTVGYQQGQEMQKWAAEHPNATLDEFAQAEHEIQGKNQLTPAEVNALQDRGMEIGNALDAVDTMRDAMDRTLAVAGGLGKVVAPFEVIGNITGISDSTEYKDFQRAKDQIKLAAGNLLRAKESATLNAGTQRLLDTIVRGGNWGDTKQNVTASLDAIERAATQELQSINRRQKATTGKDLDVLGGGQGAADQAPTVPAAPTAPAGNVIRYDAKGDRIP